MQHFHTNSSVIVTILPPCWWSSSGSDLWVDVQYTGPARIHHLEDGVYFGAVEVPVVLAVLQVTAGLDVALHVHPHDEAIRLAVRLLLARTPGRDWGGREGGRGRSELYEFIPAGGSLASSPEASLRTHTGRWCRRSSGWVRWAGSSGCDGPLPALRSEPASSSGTAASWPLPHRSGAHAGQTLNTITAVMHCPDSSRGENIITYIWVDFCSTKRRRRLKKLARGGESENWEATCLSKVKISRTL